MQNTLQLRHRPVRSLAVACLAAALCLIPSMLAGCHSPEFYRTEADKTAARIIAANQQKALGRTEPFTIETPADTLRRRLLNDQILPIAGKASLGTDQLATIEHWPEERTIKPVPTTRPAGKTKKTKPICLTLIEALQVAARNNRDYQSRKEDLFRTALRLDLESQEFRNTYRGLISSTISHSGAGGGKSTGGVTGSGDAEWSRKFKSGAALTGRIGVDLVKLLTGDQSSSLGLLADASVSIPLMRGAGRHIVTEPLTQAQRSVVYSIHDLERFKRTLAVDVAREYLSVLQQWDQVTNALENYKSLKAGTERAQSLADAERLPGIQVDQARQDELRARDRWIRAVDSHQLRLDGLKLTLGLPADSLIELDPEELPRLARRASMNLKGVTDPKKGQPATRPVEKLSIRAGALELPEAKAIKLALANRLDLRNAQGRVYDAQRGVVVAADALKADLTLTGGAAMGEGRSLSSASAKNAKLRPEHGTYSLTVLSDLPWERTAEGINYRNSYIALERATRDVQELEDRTKLQIRDALRSLKQARESYLIQHQAVRLATRRVDSTVIFLELGRAEIRDVLDSRESLVSAQNALTAALVDYRLAELRLQRDIGVLQVDEKGLWREYKPDATK